MKRERFRTASAILPTSIIKQFISRKFSHTRWYVENAPPIGNSRKSSCLKPFVRNTTFRCENSLQFPQFNHLKNKYRQNLKKKLQLQSQTFYFLKNNTQIFYMCHLWSQIFETLFSTQSPSPPHYIFFPKPCKDVGMAIGPSDSLAHPFSSQNGARGWFELVKIRADGLERWGSRAPSACTNGEPLVARIFKVTVNDC